MDNKITIDFEKLHDTLNSLDTLENVLYSVDFCLPFEDMEKYFKDLNFEHDNCLVYKNSLEEIFHQIDLIKRKMVELNTSLNDVLLNYKNQEELTGDKMKKLLGLYSNTQFSRSMMADINQSSGNVTVIPETPVPQKSNEPIDTLPIGIAIGATGVLGSAAAVLVNELYAGGHDKTSHKSEEQFEEYHVHREEEEEDDDDYPDRYYSSNNSFVNKARPYSATRKTTEAHRFYGNEEPVIEIEKKEEEPALKDIVPSKKVNLELDENEPDNDLDDFYE